MKNMVDETYEENAEGGSVNGKEDKLKVRCPHYAVCEFGKLKARNNRDRCYGLLIEAAAETARVALVYKCDKMKEVMMMVIKGNKVWHIKPDSVEHKWLSKLMKPQKCQHCDGRVFDAHIFMGRADIYIKCPRDGQQLTHNMAAAGLLKSQKQ